MAAKTAPKKDITPAADVDLDALLDGLGLDDEPAIEASTPEVDDLDSLLDELDIEEAGAVTVEASDTLADDELEALLAEVDKNDNAELYEDEPLVETKAIKPKTKKSEVEANKKKAAKTKVTPDDKPKKEAVAKPETKKETKPKVEKIDPSLPTSEILKARLGESGKKLLEIEDGTVLEMGVVNDMPKKVKEKLLNLFAHIHNGSTLSAYTVRALALLEKEGSVTNASIQADYIESWSKGTSASQAGQLVRLLRDLKICTMEGKTLTINENSLLFPLLATKEAEA